MAGGIVLSLIAMLKAFFDFIEALRELASELRSLDSLELASPSSSFSSLSTFSMSPPLSLKRPAL